MSLYLKYRPSDLTQLKGNADVIGTLEGMLASRHTLPHSFLLHGPTGCGKTTIARIIAQSLKCSDMDLSEVNTADFRGIDTIRDLIKSSQFKPIKGDVKVWIVDECHKLTNDAQNALLKILEDTPQHIYFILCTTDPQKLLPTIKGRCQQFQLRTLDETSMYALLRRVVREERQEIPKEIYDQIIQDSLGHPRNALQILEQVLNAPTDRRAEVARQTAERQSQTIELCRALVNKSSWKQISTILDGLRDQEAESIRRAVLGYCQAILLKSDNGRAGLIMEEFINPFYDSGFPQLVFACYTVYNN